MDENKESILEQIKETGRTDIYSTQDLEDIIDLELENLIEIRSGTVSCGLIRRRAENREDAK